MLLPKAIGKHYRAGACAPVVLILGCFVESALDCHANLISASAGPRLRILRRSRACTITHGEATGLASVAFRDS